jgi:hypothetical protein
VREVLILARFSHSLALVLLFSALAGVGSGIITAATFMPAYSRCYNWRRWAPGVEEILVLGKLAGKPESRVIHAGGWEELQEAGLPASRLWLFDAKAAEQPAFALASHGFWLEKDLRLGDVILLDLPGGTYTVPVAGVWHPFHPQLGDDWVVLVGEAELGAGGNSILEPLAPAGDCPQLPEEFRGKNLISWLLFNALAFIFYGALGFVNAKGRCASFSWAVKLWAGGGLAVFTGLVTAALVFRVRLSLPLFCLLPATLGILAASYFLAMLLLSGLCLLVAGCK